MTDMLYLALEILAVSALLVIAYRTLLERRTGFGWCRLFLIMLPALSVAIPLMEIPLWSARNVEKGATISLGEFGGEISIAEEEVARPIITIEEFVWGLYLLGVVSLLALMLYQWVKILRLRRDGELRREGGLTIVTTRQHIASFSFFGTIYLPGDISRDDVRVILLHEQSHIRHNHSRERLIMELQKALLWWNPFVWIAARLLTEVEEFEADRDVLQGGEDKKNYIETIFKQLFGYSPEIANGLRDSLTKKRFIMMTTDQKSRLARLRLVAILPIVLLLITLFGTTARSSEQPSALEIAVDGGENKLIYVVNGKVVESIDDIDTELIVSMILHKSVSGQLLSLLEAAGYSADDVSVSGCVEINLVDADKLVPIGTAATYQGVVVDMQNKPISGAVIRVSKDKGVITDADGKFSIEAVSGTVATCEMVGCKSQQVNLGRNPYVTVPMQSEQTSHNVIRIDKADAGSQGKDDNSFIKVDQMPTFQGGDLNKFRTWAMMQLRYPEEAKQKGISGDVIVKFVIDTDGSVRAEDVVVLKSADKLLSDEAARVIKLSPKWEPGIQKGEAVRVQYIIPLTFSLGETRGEAPKGDIDNVVVSSF